MTHYISLKQKLLDTFAKKFQEYNSLLEMPPARRAMILRTHYANRMPDVENPEGIVYRMVTDFGLACNVLEDSKTIIFSSKQAEIFEGLSNHYTDALDYKLPFSELILQFDVPLKAKYSFRRNTGESTEISALLLRQVTLTRAQVEREISHVKRELSQYAIMNSGLTIQSYEPNEDGELIQNVLCVIFSDGYLIRYGWQSDVSEEAFVKDSYAEAVGIPLNHYRNLAIACIGYINCENVYLERESVPEKVNEKRERKGKSRLEPYYICRIRGVQYDNADPTGTGAKHGIRYDVRGHFRRLDSGKTIWVRPHQRGLVNELYVPKTYLVDKQPARPA